MVKKILLLGLCFLIITGCQASSNRFFQSNSEAQIYFFNEETKAIEPVDLFLKDIIDIQNVNQVTHYIINMLSQGAKSSSLSPTLKKEVELEYYVFSEGNMLLNFNEAYGQMNSLEELIVRSSLVLSLTSFDMISSVEIVVGEEVLIDQMGNRIGRMRSEDIYLSMYASANTTVDTQFTIYCPADNRRYLKEKEVTITLHPNKHKEELIVEYLIEESSCQFLPEETKVLDVQIHDTTCYVNFNEQFLTSYLPEGITSPVAIYGIVNTLTELSNISKVQILVEGEIVDNFQGTFPLNVPLSKNFQLVQ